MISRPKISPSPLKAYVVGTIDTKGEELHYVRDLIAEAGIPTVLVDVGPRSQEPDCDVRSAEVASFHPKSSSAVVVDDRGRARKSRAFSPAMNSSLRSSLDSHGLSLWEASQ
jgi:uncharacterized protein (UPF0261 family)